MMLLHGSTECVFLSLHRLGQSCLTAHFSTVLDPKNFQEAVEQWTNVLGVSQTPAASYNNNPSANYLKTVYGSTTSPVIVGYYATGVGHSVPGFETCVTVVAAVCRGY